MNEQSTPNQQVFSFPWKTLCISLVGGILGSVLLNNLMPFKSERETSLKRSSLGEISLNEASFKGLTFEGISFNEWGLVDRDSLIQEKARQIAQLQLRDQEITDQLSHFVALYQEVVNDLMQEKKILLLDKATLASQADYTEEVKRRVHQAEAQERKAQP